MADTEQVDAKVDAKRERVVKRLAHQIGTFARAHGGAEGNVAYLGERGARIALVGEDGEWGDLVAPSVEIGRRAVEKAGVALREDFDGEFAAKIRTSAYEWKRMAGIQL
ncbi:hypothetical protein ACFWN1_00260 [Streptomyces sp. NPDC058459]|uniref:hypothetical protein n=1 Tax=Streptomyces sp. NPDC058459 TaxID=3346508 RepID=UPI00364712F1